MIASHICCGSLFVGALVSGAVYWVMRCIELINEWKRLLDSFNCHQEWRENTHTKPLHTRRTRQISKSNSNRNTKLLKKRVEIPHTTNTTTKKNRPKTFKLSKIFTPNNINWVIESVKRTEDQEHSVDSPKVIDKRNCHTTSARTVNVYTAHRPRTQRNDSPGRVDPAGMECGEWGWKKFALCELPEVQAKIIASQASQAS